MVSDEDFIKLGAQVQGLELVMKMVVAIQLSSQVKDESGFAKAADQAQEVGKGLQKLVEAMMADASPASEASGVAKIMRDEMSATAARCFDQPAAMMDQIAQVILKASTPPSQANN